MSSQKSKVILKTLRRQITSGERAPGTRLSTYDEMMDEYGVTRPTIGRVIAALRDQGLVISKGRHGLYVPFRFPLQERLVWITSEHPKGSGWNHFLQRMLDSIEQKSTTTKQSVIALVGVEGRRNNDAYLKLCDIVEERTAAGLIVVNSEATFQLPVLQDPNLPRVAIGAPIPHASLVTLNYDELLERACTALVLGGRRLAVLSPHQNLLAAVLRQLHQQGVAESNLAAHLVTPIGCASLTELMMTSEQRPDAVFISDDNLVEPFLEGLERAGLRPRKDVHVVAHCNWPDPFGQKSGILQIGFDVRDVFAQAVECLVAEKEQGAPVTRVVHPQFASEVFEPLSLRTMSA